MKNILVNLVSLFATVVYCLFYKRVIKGRTGTGIFTYVFSTTDNQGNPAVVGDILSLSDLLQYESSKTFAPILRLSIVHREYNFGLIPLYLYGRIKLHVKDGGDWYRIDHFISSNGCRLKIVKQQMPVICESYSFVDGCFSLEISSPHCGISGLMVKNRRGRIYRVEDLRSSNGKILAKIPVANLVKASINEDRWDVLAETKLLDGSVKNTLLDAAVFKKSAAEHHMYLDNVECEDLLFVPYVTSGKQSLAFWCVDSKRFNEVLEIAKGKATYNEQLKKPIDSDLCVFESFLGKSYSGNPKYLYEYLLESRPNLKFVWVINDDSIEIPGNPIKVIRGSKEYFYYLAVAKYWINNVVFPVHNKRKECVYAQLWHGTPIKRLGFDISVEGPEVQARESFYNESRNWDFLLCANKYSEEIFSSAFRFNKKFLVEGYPNNDLFFKENGEALYNKIAEKLNIPQGKRVILYAPTWRDNQAASAWEQGFDLKLNLDMLREHFVNEYVVLLRMHHLVVDKFNLEKFDGFVIDVSDYQDPQELSFVSDILVTDYSSIFFDFAVTKKPILFYTYDLEEYLAEIRGLYFDMEGNVPGPLCKTNEEIVEELVKIDSYSERWGARYETFYQKYCSLHDGKSSARIANQIFGGCDV